MNILETEELLSLLLNPKKVSSNIEGLITPCQLRSYHTKHGGETVDTPAEWVNYLDPREQSRRERESALLISREEADMSSKLF